MTPQEHQLLSGLFDRIRANSSGPRDPQAEAFIADAVRTQPAAPYIMAQSVIVLEQTLQAASQRIQELESQARPASGGAQEGSFLGNIGRSIFGGSPTPLAGGAPSSRAQTAAPPPSYAPQPPQPGPWGQPAPMGRGGGGFLQGALGAAAGVAGGVLLADSISGLFGGHNNGLGSMFGANPRGETIVNNYYGNDSSQSAQHAQDVQDDADADQDTQQDAADDSGSNIDTAGGFDSGGDSGSYDT